MAENLASGLELSRRFYAACKEMLWADIPEIMGSAAVGLVGEGSECFGFDDGYSRDHDWGPAFCIWLPRELLQEQSLRLEAALARLPRSFAGFPTRMRPEQRMGRVGPLAIEDFYARLGIPVLPETWQDWRALPEYALAVATNGAVFADGSGLFSLWRRRLLDFYPDGVFRKKIAARCMIMAQAGQYNLPRCLQRGDLGSVFLAAGRFAEAALSMAFLLNRRYMPFYKWACRAATLLPRLGGETAGLVTRLAAARWDEPAWAQQTLAAIENLCSEVADDLRRQELVQDEGNWLWPLGIAVQKSIREPALRALDAMRD